MDSKQKNDIYNKKTEIILETIPSYCTDFIESRSDKLEPSSRKNYADDLQTFFYWLESEKLTLDVRNTPYTCIENLSGDDINRYLAYLSQYTDLYGKEHKNGNQGKSRKLSSLRALCKYLISIRMISNNPTEDIKNPIVIHREITPINNSEKDAIIKAIDTGTGLKDNKIQGVQYAFNQRQKNRNAAIMSLIYDTGMSISEIANLNLEDLHLEESFVSVKQKDKTTIDYKFTQYTKNRLEEYLIERNTLYTPKDDEKALFISKKNNRQSIRSLQYMINFYKKFALADPDNKKISKTDKTN